MSIQNFIVAKYNCYPLYRGTLGAATANTYENATYYGTSYYSQNNTCHKAGAWYKGRFFCLRREAANQWKILRYDATNNTWAEFPYIDLGDETAPHSIPQLIAHKDTLYMFLDADGAENASTGQHRMRYAVSNAGTLDIDIDFTKQYDKTYDKNVNNWQDCNHVHDLIVYNNNIYAACSFNMLSVPLPSGAITSIWEIPAKGVNGYPLVHDQTSKCFTVYGNGTTSKLICLFADGKVNQITGTLSELADLTTINPAIDDGVRMTGSVTTVSIGYGCYICQIEDELHAFLNASGVGGSSSGIVSFKSLDGGTTWIETSADLPGSWGQTNAHIKGVHDPVGKEQRVLFADSSSDSFDEYVVATSGYTLLGGSTVSNMQSYVYFSKDAPCTSIETDPEIDLEKAKYTYTIYRQEPVSNVTVVPEYSKDGSHWYAATRKVGYGSGVTGLGGDDVTSVPPGSGYTFYWDWVADLGAAEHTNILFRIRGYRA